MTIEQLLGLKPKEVDAKYGDTCTGCSALLGHPDDMIRIHPPRSGVIRVTRIPDGDAPLWVREKWLGLDISTRYFVSKNDEVKGALTGEVKTPHACYLVHQDEALKALTEKSPDAAKWWHEAGFPRATDPYFAFAADDVEEIVPVTRRY